MPPPPATPSALPPCEPVPRRFLHLEDNVDDAELIAKRLTREWPGCEIVRVDNKAAFEEALRRNGFDVILSDFTLFQFDGLSALGLARELKPEVPFIFVSGTIGEERAVEALKNGGTDYVLKDRPARLVPSIQRALREAGGRRAQLAAEASIREAAARFNQLADVTNDIFLFAQLHPLKMTYVSPSVERAWGIAPEAIYREPQAWLASAHPQDRARVEQNYHAWIEGKRPAFNEEYRVLLPNHAVRWVHATGAFGKDASGRIDRLSCVAHDVTKTKEAAEQSLRTQRLESIGLLAGGIAHDLNNALTPVLMGVELLRGRGNTGNERVLAQIETSARRGAAMVRQLLGFTRGAEGQRLVLDPRRALLEVEELVTRTFPKSIGLAIKCPEKVNRVESDPTLLHQVLVNLCVNARDAMPTGGTLTLEVQNGSIDESYAGFIPNAKPGEYVIFKVSDTGTGIPPELLDKVFDPFFTTKPAGAGTGLGLTTVAGIAHNHGGFVRIQSEMGKGSCFEVYFPAASQFAVDTTVPRAAQLGLRGNGELIVLVDDEEPVRLTLKGVLETLGFEVMATHEATEALALFALHRERVKLVITDERMPYMDGSTLARTLRHMSATVPIIVMSGLHPEKPREDTSGRRAPRYLQKPFSIEELAEAVREALGPSVIPP